MLNKSINIQKKKQGKKNKSALTLLDHKTTLKNFFLIARFYTNLHFLVHMYIVHQGWQLEAALFSVFMSNFLPDAANTHRHCRGVCCRHRMLWSRCTLS